MARDDFAIIVNAKSPQCKQWQNDDTSAASGLKVQVYIQECPESDAKLLHCCQAGFKKTLVKEVATFTVDAKNFRADWEINGPMVPNLAPLEAVERLKKFQQLFEVRRHPPIWCPLRLPAVPHSQMTNAWACATSR